MRGEQSWGGQLAGHVRDTEITYQYSNFHVPGRCVEFGPLECVPGTPEAKALTAMLSPPDSSAYTNAASQAVAAIGRL